MNDGVPRALALLTAAIRRLALAAIVMFSLIPNLDLLGRRGSAGYDA